MSRNARARTTAILYLVNVALGILALIWAQQGRSAAAAQVTVAAAVDYAIVILLLARLFEPAGRALSCGVAAVGLAGCLLSVGAPLQLFAPPVSALAVFGLYSLGLSLLVARSALLPSWIGGLLMIGGLSWLTFGLPDVSRALAPYNMAPGAIAELVFTLWMLIFGVRAAVPQAVQPI